MVLRDFAAGDGLKRLLEEVLPAPFIESEQHYTPYQDQGDPIYAPDHPRNYKLHSSAGFVSRKTLEKTKHKIGLQLYNDARIVEFLSHVAGCQLHRSQDENGSVYSYRIAERHKPPWHYDESHYTAIIYLQNNSAEAAGGGEFELVPWSRPTKSKDDIKGHETIKEVLIDGNRTNVRQVVPEPGALLFFSGAHSFHRAAPIVGDTDRVGLVFTFSESQGFVNSDNVTDANEWDPDDATT